MEISKAFRDVFRKKFERLKKEEAEEAIQQGKQPVQEAPTIGETQKKFREVSKKINIYPFGVFDDKLQFDIAAYLSRNENKAFKELVNEVKSSFDTMDTEVIFNTMKEINKVVKQKANQYSPEFIKAMRDLFKQLKNATITAREIPQDFVPPEQLAGLPKIINILKSMEKYLDLKLEDIKDIKEEGEDIAEESVEFGKSPYHPYEDEIPEEPMEEDELLEKIEQLKAQRPQEEFEGDGLKRGKGRRRRAIRKNAHKK